MKKIFIVTMFFCFYGQLMDQLKHEVKIPPARLLQSYILPSYEIISKKEKFGIELGLGYDLKKARLTSSNDTIPTIVNPFNKYKKRVFTSSLALKYYIDLNIKNRFVSLFIGPFIEFEKITFIEDAFFVRQKELEAIRPYPITKSFIGQREIRPGFQGGFKMRNRSNLVVELGGRFGVLFEEQSVGLIEFRRAYFLLYPTLRIGYRFGLKSNNLPLEDSKDL